MTVLHWVIIVICLAIIFSAVNILMVAVLENVKKRRRARFWGSYIRHQNIMHMMTPNQVRERMGLDEYDQSRRKKR